jgi:bacteriocin-like protein
MASIWLSCSFHGRPNFTPRCLAATLPEDILSPLTENEMQQVQGGSFWKWVFIGLAVALGPIATLSYLGAIAVFGGAVYAGTQIE